jgi:hypothetical protein
MDCIEEEKADEKSGEEIKRERMTDEKREKKREWIFLVRRHGTREIKKGERHSGREFTLKPFAIFIFFYGFPLQRRADRELYGEEERNCWRIVTGQQTACYLSRPTPSPTLTAQAERRIVLYPRKRG